MLYCPTTIMSNMYRHKPIMSEMAQKVKTPFAKLKDLSLTPRIPCQKKKANSVKMISFNTMIFPLTALPQLDSKSQGSFLLRSTSVQSNGYSPLFPNFPMVVGNSNSGPCSCGMHFTNETICNSAFVSALIQTMCHLSHLSCSRKVFHLISSTSPSTTVSLVIFTTLIR